MGQQRVRLRGKIQLAYIHSHIQQPHPICPYLSTSQRDPCPIKEAGNSCRAGSVIRMQARIGKTAERMLLLQHPRLLLLLLLFFLAVSRKNRGARRRRYPGTESLILFSLNWLLFTPRKHRVTFRDAMREQRKQARKRGRV